MKRLPIAIVGMAGRFPGARNIDEFWKNLRDGVESIRALSDAELVAAGVAPEELLHPAYVKAAATLDDVDLFDASFFGLSPRDAAMMDPQHRHFLECTWEALESAGHPPERFLGSIGVFAGSGMNSYLLHNLLQNRRLLESAGLFLIKQTGNDKDVLTTRASYHLDLHGPSLNVQTACSTSLVAVHLACQSLLNRECDMALAGGVTIEIPHARGYIYRDGEILSRDGHCRAFDAACSGTVFSSGVGLVVLRRLEDAIEDRDTIYAVILGSAVNNDGQRKVGYLAPSVAGQAEVIAEALDVAGVSADSISYVETHGTGTSIGDPIEIRGLTQAFRRTTDRNAYCAIGSLKTNVGHLDAAAGVAGLIKTVLSLGHGKLPATLHYQTANPQINFQDSPFYVNRSLADWQENKTPRRAGVTSLGIGGTNAHVVLQEAPQRAQSRPTRRCHIIPLSAKSENGLAKTSAGLATHLGAHPEIRLGDVAFTCQLGRREFRQRRCVVARNTAEVAQKLSNSATGNDFRNSAKSLSVVFLFSGQGSQYLRMGADIYASEPIFRECLDDCAEQLVLHLGLDLREILYPSVENSAAATEQLHRTCITQPALFALEYSLARWWIACGVQPQAMLGHSIGEYVAACLADVFSVPDALAITAIRGRLMQECEAGAMLAVSLSPERFSLPGDVSLAAVNSPSQCVLSGPIDAIAGMEQSLTNQGVICHRLHTSHAFHSSMMGPILASFTEQLQRIPLSSPRIPFLSNLTGTWITAEEATDPHYWALHLSNTVQFSRCVTEMLRQRNLAALEVGPGRILTSLVQEHTSGNVNDADVRVFTSLRHRDEVVCDSDFLLTTLGQLWVAGQTVDWSVLHAGESSVRISLPTYPFERERFWIDPDSMTPRQGGTQSLPDASASVEKTQRHAIAEAIYQNDTDQWFYERRWRHTAQPTASTSDVLCWVLFLDSRGLGRQIVDQLLGIPHEVIQVTPGSKYRRAGRKEYTVRPGVREDYDDLLSDLTRKGLRPHKIVHLWSIYDEPSRRSLDEKLDSSFYSLLFLAQALGDRDMSHVDIAVISDRLHSVEGELTIDPVCATLLGPTRVIPKEYPGVTCRNIDVDLTSHGIGQCAVQIITEICATFRDPVVALRHGKRWIESFERCSLHAKSGVTGCKPRGVYLITGGLGDLALAVSEELARECHARLALLTRSPFPREEEWQDALTSPGIPERVKQQIRKLIKIQSLGAELFLVTCDVVRHDEMARAMSLVRERFGQINGVIHTAGVIEDGPLQLKSRQAATRVLDPKVQGTLVLDEVLRASWNDEQPDASLDFVALFSSVSSIVAPAGQVDYVAANAFLDAFAAYRRNSRVVAINWGPWQEIGMAARSQSRHPLLGQYLADTDNEVLVSVPLHGEGQWVLSEHRTRTGTSLLPGTAYLEMAFAAPMRERLGSAVEFEDVFFTSPLLVEPGEWIHARLHLRRNDNDDFQFSVRVRRTAWTEHATGRIGRCRQSPPADCNIVELAARCQSKTIVFDDSHRTKQEQFFAFGPRWHSLHEICLGEHEAIALLELPSSLAEDTAHYRLHPALFDLATGSALYLIEGYEQSPSVYFPMSYKRIRIYRPLPGKFYSHIRNRHRNIAEREVASFDLTFLDEMGKVLVEIEDFCMRLVRDPHNALGLERARMSQSVENEDLTFADKLSGIAPVEGAKVFTRILGSNVAPQIIVARGGLHSGTLLEEKAVPPRSRRFSSRSDIESQVAEWWQELLGLEEVGLDEDFFDLGGHSLIGARLFSKIKNTYGLSLGLSKLFEARTVRELAHLIKEATSKTDPRVNSAGALVAIQPKGTRPPLYAISGVGGNVIRFHRMAFYLGDNQPVYGLLPRGLDGGQPYHTRVEDMAADYVEAIREAQPDGPYRLVGYSFGGVVALEVAQQLIALGGNVSFVGMFDTIEWRYMAGAKKSAPFHRFFAACKFLYDCCRSRKLPTEDVSQRVRAKVSQMAFRLFSALGRPIPQTVATIEEVNTFAGANYQPKVYPGTLTLFRSTIREFWGGDDEFLGWGGLATGGVEVHHIPSTHVDILQEPGVKVLSEQLRDCLERDLKTAPTSQRSIRTMTPEMSSPRG